MSACWLLDGLRGEQIIRVVYHEMEHEDGQAAYLEADRHSLDYGLELHLASGRAISFIWSWPVCYFLGVRAGDLSRELTGEHAIWDVSSVDPWPGLLGRTIRAAHLSWFTSGEVEGDFALTAKLVVDPDAPIYVTLGVDGNADDHVEVLFSDAVARFHNRFIEGSGVAG